MNASIVRSVALCGLLMVGMGPLAAVGGEPGGPEPAGHHASAVRQADPKGTTYLYRGTFTAEVKHFVTVNWGGQDSDQRTMSATVSGTLPNVSLDQSNTLSSGSGGGTVGVDSANLAGVTQRGGQGSSEGCQASTGVTTGNPVISGGNADALFTNELTPFSGLTFVASCKDTKGQEQKRTYQYSGRPGTITDSGVPGDQTLTRQFFDALGTPPLVGAALCPGYVVGQSTCSYTLQGTLTLELIKRIPPKAQPRPPKPSKGATVAPGARNVTAGVQCPKKCTVTINLTGLKGGPRLTAPRVVRPHPGRTVKVRLTIPANKRAVVKKTGGVQVRLTYNVVGTKKYTEIRKARL